MKSAEEAGPEEDDIPLGTVPSGGVMTDDDIIAGLKKLHEGMGHASRDDMLRALRLGRARGRAVRLCRTFQCPECPRQVRPRVPKVTQPRRTTHFAQELGMDLIEIALKEHSGRTVPIAGLNMVDAHTGFQIVWPIRKALSSFLAEDVLTAFELGWASWGKIPERFSVDAGTEFKGIFRQFCGAMGISLVAAGTEAHWQQGQVEVHGGVWRLAFQKLAALHSLTTEDYDRVVRAFTFTNRANRAASPSRFYPHSMGAGLLSGVAVFTSGISGQPLRPRDLPAGSERLQRATTDASRCRGGLSAS